MDLNLVESNKNGNYVSKSKSYSTPRSTYCHICKENGHSTDDCVYNGLNKKNQNKSNKNENKSSRRQKSKRNNNKNKGSSINNVEYEENLSDEEVSFRRITSHV